jgi:hypothetical protein
MKKRVCTGALALVLLAGCTKTDENAPPKGASSADDVGYALEYPEQVDDRVAALDEGEAEVDEETGKFESYPDKLKEPTDEELVADIYRAADEAGRSEAYVKVARENDAIAEFMAADDGLIGKKVAGGVQFTAKQQGCSADLGGAAAGALKRTVDKQLEERLKQANDAHRMIDENEETLGKNNVGTLHTQADEIAHASYVAYIELPTKRAELKAMMEQRSKVLSTLEDKIKEDQKVVDSSDASDAEKKDAEARITELQASKDKLEQNQQAHKDAMKDLDKRIAAVQKKYDAALDALLESVSDSASKSDADAEGDAGGKVEGSVEVDAK